MGEVSEAPAIELSDLTPELVAYFADDPCLIWSGEWRKWWRPDAHGYTSDRSEAGVYTLADAYARTRHCGPEKAIAFVRPDALEKRDT